MPDKDIFNSVGTVMGAITPNLQLGGNTFYDQWKYNNAGLREVRRLYDELPYDQRADAYNSASGAASIFKGGKLQAGIGASAQAISGAAGLYDTFVNAARTHRTPEFDSQVASLSAAGTGKYNNVGQLINDYQQTNFNPRIDEDQVRGMDSTEKFGTVLSSGAQGASIGSIFGPVGTGIGFLAGAVGGAGSVLVGDKNAEVETSFRRGQAARAAAFAKDNFGAALEDTLDTQNDTDSVNRKEFGGRISTTHMTMSQFADKVLGNQKTNDVSRSGGFVRIKTDGGVIVRFRK